MFREVAQLDARIFHSDTSKCRAAVDCREIMALGGHPFAGVLPQTLAVARSDSRKRNACCAMSASAGYEPKATLPSSPFIHASPPALYRSAIAGAAFAFLRPTAREGSQGALKLANLEEGRSTPRSKFYALRLHWFRSWLHRPSKDISIDFIGASRQKAGMLAKALPPARSEPSRKLSMGW